MSDDVTSQADHMPSAPRRVRLGIRGKLFLVSLALILASLVAAELYLSNLLDAQLTERIRADLTVRARLVAQRVEAAPGALADPRVADALADALGGAAGVRVTLMRDDGTVVGDSEVEARALAAVENHGDRPELLGAKSRGVGADMRRSATLGVRLMYVAVPVTGGGRVTGAARVAMPLTEVDSALAAMHRALGAAAVFALAVAVGMSFFAAQVSSRKLRELTDTSRRMAAGDLSVRTRAAGGDELDALGRALDQLAAALSATIGKLQSERDLLTSVLSSMNEGVLVVDAGGRVVLANRALRTSLLLPQDLANRSVLQVIRNAELNAVVARAAQGSAAEAELALSSPSPARLLVRAVPLLGTPGAVLAVFVDVTELRRLEAVRRDFVANASHELRTPLTVVRAAAETLRSVSDDREKRGHYLQLIEHNADRLEQLVGDLLELARIESGEARIALGPVKLGPVVQAVAAQHEDRAAAKRIALTHDVGDTAALGDRRALEHVLDNLVDNALKYCPEGAAIRISAIRESDRVRVCVADTGPGIAPEHIGRIFERFYRVDAGRSRALGGTGLGLSIVKHLVEAMGGTVAVESRVGAGSTFSFTLHAA